MANFEVAVKGGSDIHIRVFSTFTDALTPMPAEIGQMDNQLVQFFDSHTVPSKYPTDTQVRMFAVRVRVGVGGKSEDESIHPVHSVLILDRSSFLPLDSKHNAFCHLPPTDDASAAERGERGEFYQAEPLRVPGQGPGLRPLRESAGRQRVRHGVWHDDTAVLADVVLGAMTDGYESFVHVHTKTTPPRAGLSPR